MKKRIVILGSTGSIGSTTANIVKSNLNDFNVIALSTNKNINKIYKQAMILKAKNIIISNKEKYLILKKKFKNRGIKIYNNHKSLNKIIKKKVDYTMCSISGLSGLQPTLDAIKYSKIVGIANKESIICAWNLINKNLKKNKTIFIPIDSEHFSIWSLVNKNNINSIDKIFITASGGPFLNKSINKIKYAKASSAIKHPNWSMGKKISVDSATLMNKVLEVIEAQKIFNIDKKKFTILIHPKSYIHAIVKFKNGIIKFLAHDTDMKIPIFNSIYLNNDKKINTKKIDLKVLNNLNLSYPNIKKFPALNFLNYVPKKNTFFETLLIATNDELVKLYLKNKIDFIDIYRFTFKIVNLKEFRKYSLKTPKDIKEISNLIDLVRLKVSSLSIK